MKKTTFLKLAVIASVVLLLASCTQEKEHEHKLTKVEAKASTCTTNGNIEYYRCSECGAAFSDEKGQSSVDDVTLPVSAHSLTHHIAVAATLENEGISEEYWECTLCGKLFSDGGGTSETTLASLVIPKGFAKLNAGTVTASIGEDDGLFGKASASNPVTVNAFYMSLTETTYERWYEVYTWATASERGTQQYTFANKGREGNVGADGAEPTDAKKEPVTGISWRDAVVWCNAASEKDGKTPVYYVEGTTEFTSDNVLRTSESQTDAAAGSGKAEKAEINENANGYRLPTEAEWEYAARGGDPSSEAWKYTYSGTDSDVNDYAVTKENSGNKTADVGAKNANSAGLYDMSGNVWEWCQDMYASGSAIRVCRGGSWNDSSSNATVANRYGNYPYTQHDYIGFRVCF